MCIVQWRAYLSIQLAEKRPLVVVNAVLTNIAFARHLAVILLNLIRLWILRDALEIITRCSIIWRLVIRCCDSGESTHISLIFIISILLALFFDIQISFGNICSNWLRLVPICHLLLVNAFNPFLISLLSDGISVGLNCHCLRTKRGTSISEERSVTSCSWRINAEGRFPVESLMPITNWIMVYANLPTTQEIVQILKTVFLFVGLSVLRAHWVVSVLTDSPSTRTFGL